MKKTRKALAAIAAAVLGTAAFGLAACTNPNLSDPSTGGDTGNNNKPSTPAVFTVTFDANGGEFEGGEETVEVKTKSDGTVEFPTAPEWDDHTFEGYTLNDDGTGGAVTATKVFTEDTTVYALWEEIVENGGDNQGGDNQGGDNQGGDNQGGNNQGGDNQGGDNQGGDNQGGNNQGGDNQGGDNQGGNNQGGDNQGGGNTGTQYPDPVTSKNIKVNGSVRTDVVLVAGNDGAEANVIPDKLQFNYYATDVSLNKDDVLEFVLEGVTIDKIWAKEGTAIVGVNATTGKTINGCEVTVLAGGTYTVSVSQYEDQVAKNEVSVYIGPYSGSYDTGSGGNQGGGDTTTNANYVLVGTQKYEFGVGNMAGTDHDFYLEDLSLTQGDVLKFYYNDAQLTGLWVEKSSAGITAKEVNSDTVTVSYTDTYNVYLKQWSDSKSWCVEVISQNHPDDNTGSGGNTSTVPDPATSKVVKVNGQTRSDVTLIAGNDNWDGDGNYDPNLKFNYYAEHVSLKKDDVLGFELGGITYTCIWAPGGTAIKGVISATVGKNITGTTVTILDDGDYTISVTQYNDQVAKGEVTIYVGPYSGDYDTGSSIGSLTVGDYYIVGLDGEWVCKQANHLGATSGEKTLTVVSGSEVKFKVAKCADTDGGINWDVQFNYGSLKAGKGKGYATTDSDGNIVLSTPGTYTVKLVSGELQITSTIAEPSVTDTECYLRGVYNGVTDWGTGWMLQEVTPTSTNIKQFAITVTIEAKKSLEFKVVYKNNWFNNIHSDSPVKPSGNDNKTISNSGSSSVSYVIILQVWNDTGSDCSILVQNA